MRQRGRDPYPALRHRSGTSNRAARVAAAHTVTAGVHALAVEHPYLRSYLPLYAAASTSCPWSPKSRQPLASLEHSERRYRAVLTFPLITTTLG